MFRRLFGLLMIIILFSVIVMSNPKTAVARWLLRDDNTYVDPVRVCRDGIDIGIGKRVDENDPPPPTVTITVTALLQPSEGMPSEVLVNPGNTSFVVPHDPFVDPDSGDPITHRSYFTIPWNPADETLLPLTPGYQIILTFPEADHEALSPPTVTVQDCLLVPAETPVGTAITYQGQLADGDQPANGNYDFQFKLFDAQEGGSQIANTVNQDDIAVSGGILSVEIDFGNNAFTGGARWLEIGVRPGDSDGGYTTLSPRQKLTAVPYALNVVNVPEHDHLGQTWIGNHNPLKIEGSFRGEAPLIITNHDEAENVAGMAAQFNGDIEVNGDLSVTGQCFGCTIASFGINTGNQPLEPGDIVSVQGIQNSNVDNTAILMNVSRATSGQAVVGVVQGKAELVSGDNPRLDRTGQQLIPSESPAQAGDYVTIVIYGPVQVRVSTASGSISTGARLAVNESGLGRSLQSTEVNGVQLSESGPVIGIALEEAAVDGLIWVLVNPH